MPQKWSTKLCCFIMIMHLVCSLILGQYAHAWAFIYIKIMPAMLRKCIIFVVLRSPIRPKELRAWWMLPYYYFARLSMISYCLSGYVVHKSRTRALGGRESALRSTPMPICYFRGVMLMIMSKSCWRCYLNTLFSCPKVQLCQRIANLVDATLDCRYSKGMSSVIFSRKKIKI